MVKKEAEENEIGAHPHHAIVPTLQAQWVGEESMAHHCYSPGGTEGRRWELEEALLYSHCHLREAGSHMGLEGAEGSLVGDAHSLGDAAHILVDGYSPVDCMEELEHLEVCEW